MGMILIIVIAVFPVYFLTKWTLRKFDIPKATVSRAKLVHKRIYSGPNYAAHLINPKAAKPIYHITFAYMVDNNWTEEEFKVSKKIYDSFHQGSEGILKHNYTEFRDFEVFEK